ncbi:unnamed protein product, partial [Prorocentrum cordatum]
AIEDGRRRAGGPAEASADVPDPWAGDGDDVRESGHRVAKEHWEALDSLVAGGAGEPLSRLHEEADAFLAGGALPVPAPLDLPGDADRLLGSSGPPASGSNAPRGARGGGHGPAAAGVDTSAVGQGEGDEGPRRVRAHAPYYSGDRAMLNKVARVPLSSVDELVGALIPGADVTTDGLLLQLTTTRSWWRSPTPWSRSPTRPARG